MPAPMKARGRGRVVTMAEGHTITVTVPLLTWLLMSKRRKRDRPRSVTFTVADVASVRYSPPWLLFAGRAVLDVPAANDPWGRAKMRKGQIVKMPRPRPHRVAFGYTRRREWVLLVTGMRLVRSDLLPMAARWRVFRALGFRGGLGAPVAPVAPAPQARRLPPGLLGGLAGGRTEVRAPADRRRRVTSR